MQNPNDDLKLFCEDKEFSQILLLAFLCFIVSMILMIPFCVWLGPMGLVLSIVFFLTSHFKLKPILMSQTIPDDDLLKLLSLLKTDGEKSVVSKALDQNSGKFKYRDFGPLLKHVDNASRESHEARMALALAPYYQEPGCTEAPPHEPQASPSR